MSHNPKLEIFQVWLKPIKKEDKTFRDFVIDTTENDFTDETTNAKVFASFFQNYIKAIDTADFIKNEKKKKAFTAYDTNKLGGENSTITFDSDKFIIEGTLEGGRFGQKRNKSSMDDKAKKEGIHEKDIILDKFYFLLYTPFDSELGILFLQSYSADSIADIYTDFIRNLFKKEKLYRKSKVEKFVPQRIIKEFRKSSNIKKFTFSSRFVIDQMTNEPIGVEEEEFSIRIEAVSKNGLPKESLSNWIQSIGSKMFNSKQLSEFNKGKVYLKNTSTNKECPFDIDSELDIKPVIYLEGKVDINADGHPDYEKLSEFCIKLLEEEIKPEMYITDEIQER